jgi:hypothetical protein
VLGASGHIAGVINPPAKKKRSHWTNDKLPESAHDWLAGAQEHPGSWWPDWVTWLGKQAARSVPRQPITAMTTTRRSNPRRALRQTARLSFMRAGPRRRPGFRTVPHSFSRKDIK